MNIRRSLIGLITAGGVVGWCEVAAATSYEYGRPIRWLNSEALLCGLWATSSLLFGFIERPFYTAAGVERNALARSIQINAISSVVFGLFFFFLFGLFFDLLTAFFPITLLVWTSIVAGLEYLLLAEAERKQISFAPLWLGNAASMATLIAVSIAARLPIGEYLARYISANPDHYAYAGIAMTVAWVVGTTVALLRQKPSTKTEKLSIRFPPADESPDAGRVDDPGAV